MVNEDYKVIFCDNYTHLVKKQPPQICIADAKQIVAVGLNHYIDDDKVAQWLPEYDEVTKWLNNNKRKGLLLIGKSGRGKSVLCKSILPSMLRHFYPHTKLYQSRAIDLLHKMRPNNGEYFELLSSDIILIDDFGVEPIASNYGERYDIFSDIVDIAECENKLLIATSNLMPKDIETRYGLRTLDRLKHITKPVLFDGDSLRATK